MQRDIEMCSERKIHKYYKYLAGVPGYPGEIMGMTSPSTNVILLQLSLSDEYKCHELLIIGLFNCYKCLLIKHEN